MKLSLKEFFAGFLRTRHIGRHFRRLVLLDSLTVLQNLAMPFTLDIEPVAPDMAARATALAADVGLEPAMLDRRVGEGHGLCRGDDHPEWHRGTVPARGRLAPP